MDKKSFTLVEILIAIGVLAALSVIAIIVLDPTELNRQGHDSKRVSNLGQLDHSLYVLRTESAGAFMGTSSIVYVSLPDATATTTAGTDCSALNLSTLPDGWSYHCSTPSLYKESNGQGWMPVNFKSVPAVSSLATLPIDPLNTTSSRLYYVYTINSNGDWELNARLESNKYGRNGAKDAVATDNGDASDVLEKGSLLTLMPAGAGGLGASPMDGTYHYAWSENIGWIDFGDATGNAGVSSEELSGYASSTLDYIALNCASSPNGDICGTSDFKVSNDGAGILSGWAWGGSIGWISFNCSDRGVCGTSNYKVSIDSSGNFSGWAWSENIGWISFNCSNTSSCATSDYRVKTLWRY